MKPKNYLQAFILLISIIGFAQNPTDLDNSFNYVNSSFRDAMLNDNGKLVIATRENGSSIGKLVRLNNDGSIDNTFSFIGSFNKPVISIDKQSSGKYIVATSNQSGTNNQYNGNLVKEILRFNQDGSLDNTFIVPQNINNLRVVKVQSDDKILFGGYGLNRFGRLNQDGSIDNSFNVGTGITESTGRNNNVNISTIKIDSNSKIIIGGSYELYNGVVSGGITRLNNDGTIDTNFDTGTGFNWNWEAVRDIEIQNDGKFIVVGDFSSFDGSSVSRIIRLNSDGSKDNSFYAAINSQVEDVLIQTDSKIIVGGYFTAVTSGVSKNHLCRFNSDGSIDNSFDIQAGFNSSVTNLIIQPDQKIIIGGTFSTYNNNNVSEIIRLQGDSTLSIEEYNINETYIYPNPINKVINVNLDKDFDYEIYNILGVKILQDKSSNKQINIEQLSNGTYILRINRDNKIINKKFIKQ